MAMSIALRKPGKSESFPLEIGGVAGGRRNGRGAATNRSGRYEPIAYESVDDGWESLGELEADIGRGVAGDDAPRSSASSPTPPIVRAPSP